MAMMKGRHKHPQFGASRNPDIFAAVSANLLASQSARV
jgi:hypothetical protein